MNEDSRLIVPPLDDEPWPTLGPEVCDFIEDNLCHGPGDLIGQPKTLSNEERLFLYRSYEIYPRDHKMEGRRRFKRCAYYRRKGVAKTEDAALIAIVECDPNGPVRFDGWDAHGNPVGRPVVDPYIPMLAFTEEQVEELAYRAVYEILSHCALGDTYDLTLERIKPKDTTGRIVSIAGSPSARDGARTTFQHFDEPHRMLSVRVRQAVATMLRNIPKRYAADAWTLETSTMYGPGEGSVAEDSHEYALAVLRGEVKDPRFYFDHRQASEKWNISKDEELRAAIVEASGDAAAWADVDSIVALFHDPSEDENEFRRYWLNQRRRSSNRWPVAYLWPTLAKQRTVEPGTEIVLAFDGSYNHDSTQLVGCTVEAIPHVFHIASFARPAGEKNWRVPVLRVLQAVEDAMETYRVLEFAPDPPGWRPEIETWEETYGETVVRFETNQPRRFGPACDDLEQGVRDKSLTHDGSPIIAQHMNNAVTEKRGAFTVITKDRPDDPEIDAADATCVALHRARWHWAHMNEGIGVIVYDSNEERSGQ